MSRVLEPGALFAACEIAPRRKPKEVAPAYRLGRALALQFRAETLAEFRAHQGACGQCASAADVAEAKGTKPSRELCIDGYLLFHHFAMLDYNLRRGYYPDHERRHAARRPAAQCQLQGTLF
jgi:hypothetical protein